MPMMTNQQVRLASQDNYFAALEQRLAPNAQVMWVVIRLYGQGHPNINTMESIRAKLNGMYTCKTEDVTWQPPKNVTFHLNLTNFIVGK